MADQAISFWQYYQADYPLNVMVVGRTVCDSDYRVVRESSHIMALDYNEQGSGVFEINGKTYHPGRHSVLLLTKKSRHMYATDPQDLWRKRWIVFDGLFMERLIALYLPEDCYCFSDCHLTPYFDEIDRLVFLHKDNYLKLMDKLSVILLEMVLYLKNQVACTQYDLAERVRQTLDMQIERKLSLSELAAEFHYSKNHIIRVFREKYGITPYQYFIERKVAIAKLYLCNTNCSVIEIANLLSFTDEHYFSNYFRSAVGSSPSQYRKEMQKRNGGETPSLIQ